MSDNLDKYLPEFDEDETGSKIAGLSRDQIIDMLIYAYKEKRVIAKSWDESLKKLRRTEAIIAEPSSLVNLPWFPLRTIYDGCSTRINLEFPSQMGKMELYNGVPAAPGYSSAASR